MDNTTNGANDPTFGRPSIKLLSNYTITQGNLVLFDAVHMPFGVSNIIILIPQQKADKPCHLVCVFWVFAVLRCATLASILFLV